MIEGRRYRTKTLVVKIGSGVLLTEQGKLRRGVSQLMWEVRDLRWAGVRVLLVVSGAVSYLKTVDQVGDEASQRISSALAWVRLARALWTQSRYSYSIMPLLLAADERKGIWRKQEVLAILNKSLDQGLNPVLNEFDSMHLNCFGGNDILAARVAVLVGADQVLILSTPEGSPRGVGGADAKDTACAMLRQRGIDVRVVNGKTPKCITDNVM